MKNLFGQLAELVTGKPPLSLALKRKRSRDESKGAFSRALILTARAVRRLIRHPANDDDEIQIEAERLLRLEIDEYATEQESFEDGSQAHYSPVATLDLKM